MTPLTFGSLFSGVGGLDLGLEAAGMKCMWQVERDLYARRVLRTRFPGVRLWQDVTRVGAAELSWVDIICGGFPCQDISPANPNGLGLAGSRSGLWSHFARIIGERRPRGVIVENNGQNRARWLPVVLGDLAALRFDAEWHCIEAARVGSPQLRDRCYVVAWAVDMADPLRIGWQQGSDAVRGRESDLRGGGQALADAHRERELQPQGRESHLGRRIGDGGESLVGRDLSDPNDTRREGSGTVAVGAEQPRDVIGGATGSAMGALSVLPSIRGIPLPTARAARFGVPLPAALRDERESVFDPEWWATEPDVGRVAHGVPARVDRLRGLGNAVVPEVGRRVAQRLSDILDALANQPAGAVTL